MPVALGDCVKTIQIQVEGDLHAGEGSGTANILADDSTYECVRISLHLQTLDELIGRNEIPATASVIKIDTDGYDLKVFEGGRSFLKTARPVIFGEFSAHCMNWHHQTVSDVVSFANELNYVVWSKSGKEWRFSETIDHKNYVQDLLMVPIEYVTQYAWCLQPNATTLQT